MSTPERMTWSGQAGKQRNIDTSKTGLEISAMITLWKFPALVFAVTFVLLSLSTLAGALARKRTAKVGEAEREDLGVILPASLTLLGLIIGFSFAMSTGRYDQRKNYEEEEANAIGTEYVRADLLAPASGDQVRALLRSYLNQRIVFYETRDAAQLRMSDGATAQLQAQLWTACVAPASAQPSPLTALSVSGMNDVLNSQGYTLAAWRNTIPVAAWILMEAIAVFCSVLVGYGARRTQINVFQLILPLLVALSFFLIADIDSPRNGIVRVPPENLLTLSQSFQAH
jgi:hypothetical protein